jgi:glycerol-3-phosphate acyltransferase PlsY
MLVKIWFLVFTYLLSAVPFGLLVVRLVKRVDVRNFGSGNIGATNVYRVAGFLTAFIVFLLDGLKGFVPTFIAMQLWDDGFKFFVGFVAILGHSFPIYLRFKGGRAVATALFVMLALSPIIAVISFVAWIICFKLSKISSLSSIIAASVFAVLSIFIHSSIQEMIFNLFIAGLVIVRHHKNIKNLIKGTETTTRI